MATKKYLDLSGLTQYDTKIKSVIPSKTSDLTNDSGFITDSKVVVINYGSSISFRTIETYVQGNYVVICKYVESAQSMDPYNTKYLALTNQQGMSKGSRTFKFSGFINSSGNYRVITFLENGTSEANGIWSYEDIDLQQEITSSNKLSYSLLSNTPVIPSTAEEIEYTNEEYYTHLTYGDDFTSVESIKDFADLLLLELDYDIDGIQTQLDGKQTKLYSGTNIKTINNQSILGSGNIDFASTETDPVFSASASAGITSNDISNWNAKSNLLALSNETIIADLSLNSSSQTAVRTTNITRSGYKPMGIVGYEMTGTNHQSTNIIILQLSTINEGSGTVQWRLRNLSSTANATITLKARILWVKV